MLKKLFAAIGVGSLIALGGTVAAHADVPVVLTASPTTITLGESSTLTATGLEDGLNAIFAISTPALPNNQGMIDPESVTIAGGPAITTFTPNAAGTYVIDLYTQYSESPVASVTITVLAAPVVPTLPATGGEVSPWLILSGVGALLLGAFLVARTFARRRPRED